MFVPWVTYLAGTDGAEPNPSPFVERTVVVTSTLVAVFMVDDIVWAGAC